MKRVKSADRSNTLSGLTGSVTALATPFLNGGVDLEAVALLCERQVRGGTAAIVVCGSTGEGPSLTEQEQGAIVAAAVAATPVAPPKRPIWPGSRCATAPVPCWSRLPPT